MSDDHFPFSWATALKTGVSHEISGLPCQDAIYLQPVTAPDGTQWMIGALCDGAGSAPLAEVGATITSYCFTHFISEALRLKPEITEELEDLLCCAMLQARTDLKAVAASAEQDLKDYACTLLGFALSPEKSVFLQIGDGVILSQAKNTWSAVFQRENFEYCNVTRFITDDDAFEAVRILEMPSPDTLLLTSDGLEDLLVHGNNEVHTPLPDYLAAELKKYPSGEHAELCQYLDQLCSRETVRSRTDDDLSLIVLSNQGARS